MACDTQAGLEAQKLISVSLGKMAASRMGRTGTSLHKSLLVASVLHRARHVFLEESYHAHRAAHPEAYLHAPPTPTEGAPLEDVYTPPLPSSPPAVPVEGPTESDTEDKENPPASPPPLQEQNVEAVRTPLAESNSNSSKTRSASLKRRRCVSQQETQEAVWSILPKRPRTCSTSETLTEQQQQKIDAGNSMEVEHITSLVSIFSFGGQRVDMCGTEAAREAAQFQPVALAV
ncbi:Immediate early response 5 protein [Chionoecetes opilio]|uniref:Immediate early response 5 protein n=1 Tax=Chionoecetes opilio TaxID=41210 RepID=A0A8J4YX53_CHIOP|nr:Immediate early response 5 protein [Chionoecetes opilio]